MLAAAYVIMALGLNIVVGFAGLLDLGYVAFFAIGAHTAAYFGSRVLGHPPRLPRSVLVIAVVATTAAGVLIGLPTLRLRGDYVGIVTLAFGEIIAQVTSNGREIRLFGGTLTGGPQGISAVDRIDLPLLAPFSALDLRPWAWFALALVALMLAVSLALRDSRVGRAWIAVRDDEVAAAAPASRSCARSCSPTRSGGALGGCPAPSSPRSSAPSTRPSSRYSFSIFILAMVVLGGLGSLWGVVAGAVVLSAINSWLLPDVLYDLPSRIGLDFDLSQVSAGIYGVLLVVLMLVRPEGLLPERRAQAQAS